MSEDFIRSIFREGRGRERKGDQWFHILPDGAPAYPERYDFVGHFYEGRSRVKKDNQWFHITPDGQPAYRERYLAVGNFWNGKAFVVSISGKKSFYIDKNGNIIS